MKLATLAAASLVLGASVSVPSVPAPIDFDGFDSTTLPAVSEDGDEWGLKIVIFNVGNGDALLVLARNGDAAVIDTGRRASNGAQIAAFLGTEALNGVGSLETIDLLYTTHYDEDHIKGIKDLTQTRGVRIRKAYDQGRSVGRSLLTPSGRDSSYALYCQAVGDKNDNYAQDADEPNFVRHRIDYRKTEFIGSGDDVEIRCVSVRGDTKGTDDDVDLDLAATDINENDGSIALLVRLGEFEFYTAGDQTCEEWTNDHEPVEENLVKANPFAPYVANEDDETDGSGADIDIDVMKASHHGSDTSSSNVLVEALDPEVAVFSADFISTYKHPRKVALMQFEENRCYSLITGDGHDPETDDFSGSTNSADDTYNANPDAVFNEVGQVVITVHQDGTRYTVRADTFVRTFSAVDSDNQR